MSTSKPEALDTEAIKPSTVPQWQVYILLASDQRLYTGITTDIRQRWHKHTAKRGAKFFYGRKPVALLYLEGNHSRSSASKREYSLKQLSRLEKWQLINTYYGPLLEGK